VAQQTGRQYDDDLTVGADEYNESFSTGYVDLFEPLGDNDSPIAKLKTIILSIDWEITDDILHQLHSELQDLKDIWAGNKINLVYIQALEKIGRYIFAEKANSHPNAIKLLLTFYSNLEKIVSSVSMSEEEKKQLLLQDVKRFDQFKAQIAPASRERSKAAESPVAARPQVVVPAAVALPSSQGQRNVLTNLKAIVLGIDWEISDSELVRLSEEVSKLEKVFSENRAKLIFLQGIGALGNYIRSAKSNAHPDAFKLLHSFCKGLEKTYNEVLSGDQEKEILFAEVKKFNAFKSVIAAVATEVVVPVDDTASLAGEGEVEEEESDEEGGVFAPAFADMPEGVRGFREDTEAVKDDVDKSVASFLGEEEAVAGQRVVAVAETFAAVEEGPEVSSRLDALFGNADEPDLAGAEVSADIALSGVEVETEADDDSDEKALPLQAGSLAPALAETSGQSAYAEDILSEKPSVASSLAGTPVVPGVDVETEADDESGEAALPREDGGLAPALAFSDETYGFREAEFIAAPDEEEFDLEDRLHSFFGAEIEEASQGNGFPVSDDVHEAVSPAAAFSAENYVSKSEETTPSDFVEEQELFTPEILAVSEDVDKLADADINFEEEIAERSVEARKEELGVVFEPVGDDVPVDELPVESGFGVLDYDTLDQQAFMGIRECVASILLKKYEIAFPAFFVEINKLRQGERQVQYVKNTLLQLLLTVGQYIDTYRTVADAEALTLLQSLCDKLEQMYQRKMGPVGEREQVLFKETGAVLLWQQRLIADLMARNEGEDASSGDLDDLTDLFSEK
jgi:pilus assembly protein FimV